MNVSAMNIISCEPLHHSSVLFIVTLHNPAAICNYKNKAPQCSQSSAVLTIHHIVAFSTKYNLTVVEDNMISDGRVAAEETPLDVLLQPTAKSKKKNRKRVRNNNKGTVICYANNLQGIVSEGVCLAVQDETETDAELYDGFEDDNTADDDFCYSNWKKGCHFCRSVSKNTKPKVKPHKRVKTVDSNRTTVKSANIKENTTAQKNNIQKRLDKMNLQRTGLDTYFKRLETALKESVKSAKKGPTGRGANRANAIDHPNALKYELKHNNASKDNNNQTNRIADLQHREIGPEDYELLLLLDASIAPKTVSTSFLTSLRVVIVEEANLLGELCAICIEPYRESDKAKQLPCQHYFHENCIDNWLSNASLNCPLDGVSVEH